MEPHFRCQGAKMCNRRKEEMKPWNQLNRYWEIATWTWPKNFNFFMIYFRPEVVDNVITCRNVKTIEGYLVVNFEVASSYSFPDIKIKIISWRWQRRSTIALSENAFAFRLKEWRQQKIGLQFTLTRSPPTIRLGQAKHRETIIRPRAVGGDIFIRLFELW